MPQISNTPESLLPRSDSRNPATTCRGITAQGRPCRRSLASPNPSPAATPRKKDPRQEAIDVASLYCWQHKDQDSSANPHTTVITPAKTRTSIDTLMDRLGVLEINDDPVSQKPKPPHRRRTNQSRPSEKRRPKKKTTFCCFQIVEDSGEDEKPSSVQRPKPPRPTNGVSPSSNPNQKIKLPASAGKPQHAQVSPAPQTSRPSSSNTGKPSTSQTQSLLSWIPSTLSPETTSILITELAKPISSADDEGYIYMFWVMPPTTTTQRSADTTVTRDIASSLLPHAPQSSNHLRPPTQPRSVSEAIRAARDLNALTSNPTSTTPGTLRLKIGRTSNVHRRLAEWSKQCSYDLTLIRYYPYTPSSSASSSPARMPPSHNSRNRAPSASLVPGRKVPHVHRVERLIHLELADQRVRDLGQCPECGKEHREWFEVEAEKESLRRVDECIRRWVSWAESMC
ncbi:hypothetical protein N7471_011291 [Penicillium samsonianum]|uniref:uncharacterized protein n=1 Tax=Penicillium samsonianum TaxID=1882272 RepID=UPI00254951C6|nr:uncharacterized protein N7471_011291 [Penicillium samsonianum]KAJ6123974.1 hypothetical protein N7471_011291 [Penicillium samsonianum]